jgi:hypothetical protein
VPRRSSPRPGGLQDFADAVEADRRARFMEALAAAEEARKAEGAGLASPRR